jgi:hypothetical protein
MDVLTNIDLVGEILSKLTSNDLTVKQVCEFRTINSAFGRSLKCLNVYNYYLRNTDITLRELKHFPFSKTRRQQKIFLNKLQHRWKTKMYLRPDNFHDKRCEILFANLDKLWRHIKSFASKQTKGRYHVDLENHMFWIFYHFIIGSFRYSVLKDKKFEFILRKRFEFKIKLVMSST